MKYWAFKTTDPNIIQTLNSNRPELVYSFLQKRNFGGAEGDQVVFLLDNSRWRFSHKGTISKIRRSNSEGVRNTKILFEVTVTDIKALSEPNSLKDFSYTLLKINKWFNDPIKHFREPYSHLPDHDYEAITNSQIFISRTAFGKVVNGLHLEHRKSFLQQIIQDNTQLFRRGNNYIEAFQMLKEYIEDYIYPDIEMMREIGDYLLRLDENSAHTLEFSEHGKRERNDNIMQQVSICNTFLGSEFGENYLTALLNEIQTVASDEASFGASFNSIPLPISLN
ncbi:hypothetical protein [Flavisolibacter tropicus]|uniref:Uncharacterized protein n=1 Tax=Flavisolibacter tropicus TaxID=1492898 RepID=A0A172TUC4_9BACT|nr:hypothetical protein [Flavisolibacter tropicus]ANE50640.1 hypothetical protein SY85_09125 [Flavisolibacter tropicus]